MQPSYAPKATNSELPPDGLLRLSLPGEHWKSSEALGWRYFVSTLGRLASAQYRGAKGKVGIIKPAEDANGYLRTMLLLGGKYTTVKVHRLVVETWNGPIAAGLTVNHKNFVRTDNAVTNLEVLTMKENIRSSARAGRYGKSVGAINGNSKLTDEKVRNARLRWERREIFQRELAAELGVSRRTMGVILRRKAWRHVA